MTEKKSSPKFYRAHAETVKELRDAKKEIRRLRRLARDLANMDHYNFECICQGCQAAREVLSWR